MNYCLSRINPGEESGEAALITTTALTVGAPTAGVTGETAFLKVSTLGGSFCDC